jgi:DMSO/TMAO reductase YedYZ heme-binding membrane subunit
VDAHLLHPCVILTLLNVGCLEIPAMKIGINTRPKPEKMEAAVLSAFLCLSHFLKMSSLLRNLFFHFLHKITHRHYSLVSDVSELLITS